MKHNPDSTYKAKILIAKHAHCKSFSRIAEFSCWYSPFCKIYFIIKCANIYFGKKCDYIFDRIYFIRKQCAHMTDFVKSERPRFLPNVCERLCDLGLIDGAYFLLGCERLSQSWSNSRHSRKYGPESASCKVAWLTEYFNRRNVLSLEDGSICLNWDFWRFNSINQIKSIFPSIMSSDCQLIVSWLSADLSYNLPMALQNNYKNCIWDVR